MQSAKVLVIDLKQVSALGNSLKNILYASPDIQVQLPAEEITLKQLIAPCNSIIIDVVSVCHPDIIFVVSPLLQAQDMELASQAVLTQAPDIPVMIAAEVCEPGQMLSLLNSGAADIFTPPLQAQDICTRLRRILQPKSTEEKISQTLKEKMGLRQLIGESSAFMTEIKKIPLVAKCHAGVLISGETGTGKELCARAIHYLSPRAGNAFIPINCGAIPTDLVENELFGHVQGAFTHANNSKFGLIAEADKGSLFLDEIDCLTPAAQVKLLRFLQEKEYRQLGSTKINQVDVRVIAATSLNIAEAVRTGRIRQDLYYRLDVIPITLPALRERRDDIPLLSRHFLGKYCQELDKQVHLFHPQAIQKLLLHDWPGNVRELEYVIERAVLFCEGMTIKPDDIIFPRLCESAATQVTFKEAKNKMIDHFERTYIQGLLQVYEGNISKASKAAQKNRRAFWQLMRKHQINAQAYRVGQ